MTKLRLFVAVVVLASCAHLPKPIADCTSQLTQDLTNKAAAALLEVDYEEAVARELGGLASCLVVAAVQAAVRQAKALKLSPAVGSAGSQITIAQHGDAWLAKHGPGTVPASTRGS